MYPVHASQPNLLIKYWKKIATMNAHVQDSYLISMKKFAVIWKHLRRWVLVRLDVGLGELSYVLQKILLYWWKVQEVMMGRWA